MTLYGRCPQRVEALGRSWRLRADFRRVLHALDILADDSLYPGVRIEASLRLMVRGRLPRGEGRRAVLLAAVRSALFDGAKCGKKRVLDYTQDAGLIRAAFRQAYQIDLTRAKMSWFLFRDLLSALPEDTLLSRVMGWRAADIPRITPRNREQVARLIQLQNAYALRDTTGRGREAGMNRLFDLMVSMAGGDGT